jgi:hypothetical protein
MLHYNCKERKKKVNFSARIFERKAALDTMLADVVPGWA